MVKKVLMVIAHENFRDEELIETRKVLEGSGSEVTIASTSTSPAKGMFGASAQPNILVAEANVENFDALIFIGGGGAQGYFNDPVAMSLAKKATETDKILGAICIAPVILANAGVLAGKKATVWNGDFVAKLTSKGAVYTGDEVTWDGKIITGNGPKAATNFGKAIVKALE